MKWILGIAIAITLIALPVIKTYRSLFSPNKIYVLESATGKVWRLDSFVRPGIDGDPLRFLLPWAESPPVSVDSSSAFYVGTLKVAAKGTACTALWRKQIACISDPVEQDERLSLLDYYALRDGETSKIPSGHPVVDEVNQNLRKFELSDGEPQPVFPARAALIYSPSSLSESWRTLALGHCVVFQGRGSAFFERATGIELPPVGPPD
jgi:hypothetical protein